jgi:hypothetical protein
MAIKRHEITHLSKRNFRNQRDQSKHMSFILGIYCQSPLHREMPFKKRKKKIKKKKKNAHIPFSTHLF